MNQTTNITLVNGQIKIEQVFDFSDKHKEALINMVKNKFFEHRGEKTQEDYDIHTELEVMGLAEENEMAWHPTWKPTEAGKKIAASFPINEITIGDSIEEDYWYTHMSGKNFKVKAASNYSEIREMFYGQAEPQDVYIVTEGEFKGNGILKKHCKQ